MIKIYNRREGNFITEEQYGSEILEHLYGSKFGRILLKILINPTVSKLTVLYNGTILSKCKINKLIKNYSIDMSKYEEKKYLSFNDFFTRKFKSNCINIDMDKKRFIAPAESKLFVYKISKDLKINVKGSIYTLKELLKEEIDDSFIDGNCLIFRLSVHNYHRYCFVDDGEFIKRKKIRGCLHTVSSISKDYKIYKENKRVVSKLNTRNFGDIYYIEVGALLVGDIVNRKVATFKKGEEKGHFNMGGSTIIVLTKNNVKIDKDIITHSKNGVEVLVEYGESIGEVSC